MIDTYSKVLQVLLNLINDAFSKSSLDRQRLNDIEWNSGDDAPSILGEVEVRADTVIGIAKTLLKKEPENVEKLLNALGDSSIYNSEALVFWIANDSDNFEDFFYYMEVIENLRASILAFIKKNMYGSNK